MSETRSYKACIYTRLSRDDGDKLESDSITNQKALIRDFISKHPEIAVVSEKSDDGYSGVNFNRPGFQEMMEEIRSGQVDCVVVKDLSRFGRNYIEAGNYIERVFPFIGVRFIAINDSYDSCDRTASDSLIIPFKNLINDAYCKDISTKVRTQLDVKRRSGQFIGAFAVYGYMKDPDDHNHLVADPYASAVVQSIFKWKVQGMSQGRIAQRLNDNGILCPMEYKLSLGMNVQTGFRVHQKALWSAHAVSRILTNEVYTGVLIQGKTTTPNYKVKKVIRKDASEWVRTENAHEAVIDRETFDAVQTLMKKDMRTAPDRQQVYPLSGFLKCADCGQNLVRKKYVSNDREYVYYVCSTWKDGKGCTGHRVLESSTEHAVLRAIQERIHTVLGMERLMEMVNSLPESRQNVFNYDAQIVRLKEEIEQNRAYQLKLYETLQSGLITQEEYFLFKKSYADRIEAASGAIMTTEQERDRAVSRNREEMSWMEQFRKHEGITELDRQVLVDLVEQIVVFDDQKMEIVFRFSDEFEKAGERISFIPDEVKATAEGQEAMYG